MVTITPGVLPHHRSRDGFIPVKMRVYLNRRSRWIATNLIAYPKDLTRHCTLRDGAVKDAANELAARMRACISDLSPFVMSTLTVDDVVQLIEKRMGTSDFHLDFCAFAEDYLRCKKGQTLASYRTALSAFRKFIGGDIDCSQITAQMLRDFLASQPPSGARYLALLSHIYNNARERYNDEDAGVIRLPRNPFAAVKIPRLVHHGQHSLPESVLQKMMDADDVRPAVRYALDMFLLSYALMGANLADLFEAEPPKGGVWRYERKKTRDRRSDRAEMMVRVPDEVCGVLARLTAGAESGRWLSLSRRYANLATAVRCVNNALHKWAESAGVGAFTFYAARKSFATVCRAQGVEKATIDECLAHVGDYRIADIYIERNWELLWDAQRRAVSVLKWQNDF